MQVRSYFGLDVVSHETRCSPVRRLRFRRSDRVPPGQGGHLGAARCGRSAVMGAVMGRFSGSQLLADIDGHLDGGRRHRRQPPAPPVAGDNQVAVAVAGPNSDLDGQLPGSGAAPENMGASAHRQLAPLSDRSAISGDFKRRVEISKAGLKSPLFSPNRRVNLGSIATGGGPVRAVSREGTLRT